MSLYFLFWCIEFKYKWWVPRWVIWSVASRCLRTWSNLLRCVGQCTSSGRKSIMSFTASPSTFNKDFPSNRVRYRGMMAMRKGGTNYMRNFFVNLIKLKHPNPSNKGLKNYIRLRSIRAISISWIFDTSRSPFDSGISSSSLSWPTRFFLS